MKPKWTFLPNVITKLNIINKKHDFSKLYSIYHHNNSKDVFLMSVLVEIDVLHMHLAENVFKF